MVTYDIKLLNNPISVIISNVYVAHLNYVYISQYTQYVVECVGVELHPIDASNEFLKSNKSTRQLGSSVNPISSHSWIVSITQDQTLYHTNLNSFWTQFDHNYTYTVNPHIHTSR